MKVERLRALAAEHDIPLAATMAVGDGANDLDMIRAAGPASRCTPSPSSPSRRRRGSTTATSRPCSTCRVTPRTISSADQPSFTAMKRLAPVGSVILNSTAGRPASLASLTSRLTSSTVATFFWLTSTITSPGTKPFS